jgi:hypothetical protein
VFDRFEPARLTIKVGQIVLRKGDEPDALADRSDADRLAGKDVTEVDELGDGQRIAIAAIAMNSPL